MHVPMMNTPHRSLESRADSMSRIETRVRKPLHRLAALAALVGLLAAAAYRPAPQAAVAPSGQCATPSAFFVAYVDTMVAGNDSLLSVAQRQSFNLPSLPYGPVSVVTDSLTCERARIAADLSRIEPDSNAVSGVSVLRVGPSRYVVTDTGASFGEFRAHITFDSALTVSPLAVWGH
jgi:hypothetical protein